MTDKPSIPPILNDLPTDKDELDFQPYVEALADILLDPNTHTPLVLGRLWHLGQRIDQPGEAAPHQGDQRSIATRPLSSRRCGGHIWGLAAYPRIL